MAKITLDAKTFQALASSTRLTVLRALDERRKTLTELARDLQLNKATVHEHLQLLAAAGLVRKRDDEGRKWIYYELTWTGEKLLHPQETTTFNVLLGLSVAAAGGGVFMLGRALGWWLAAQPMPSLDEAAPEGDQPPAQPTMAGYSSDSQPTGQGGGSGGAAATTAPDDRLASAEAADQEQAESPVDDGADFFGDGGWLAIVLMLAATVFVGLATFLRRQMRPGEADPAGADDDGSGDTGPGT